MKQKMSRRQKTTCMVDEMVDLLRENQVLISTIISLVAIDFVLSFNVISHYCLYGLTSRVTGALHHLSEGL